MITSLSNARALPQSSRAEHPDTPGDVPGGPREPWPERDDLPGGPREPWSPPSEPPPPLPEPEPEPPSEPSEPSGD